MKRGKQYRGWRWMLLGLLFIAACGSKKGNSFLRGMCEGNCGQTMTSQEITDNELSAQKACQEKCREKYGPAEKK